MKTLKKSLSLFLAVVMLLSCWVWVAPEKAAAAAPTSYDIKINYGTKDSRNDLSGCYVRIKYKENNGTGAEKWLQSNGTGGDSAQELSISNTKAKQTGLSQTWSVPGWPTFIDVCFKGSSGVKRYSAQLGNIEINGKVVVEGSWSFSDKYGPTWHRSFTPAAASGGASNSGYVSDSADGGGSTEGTWNWPRPAITTVSGKPSTSETITVPRYETAEQDLSVFSSKVALAFYDQYGVKIVDSNVTNYLEIGLKTTDSVDALFETSFTKEDNGLWYENGNVWYNKNMQALMLDKSGVSYYLYYHYANDTLGSKKERLTTITFNYPKYKAEVHPDGSIDGLGASMDMSDNSAISGIWTNENYYGVARESWPKGTASKVGYIFKGFWTAPQPTEGDAGYNAVEAKFATPVTSEDFVNLYGGTAGEEYVVKNGRTYYNAGELWAPNIDKGVTKNITYYGWWLAEDISVKFYDVDGTYLDTKTTKTGKVEAEDWYPDPKDGYVSGAYEYQGFAKQWRDITGEVVSEGSYAFNKGLKTLHLTPIYKNKEYTKTYLVNFMSTYGYAEVSKEYDYRHLLQGSDIPNIDIPWELILNPNYTYEFTGWSSQIPANGANYHVVAKDDASFTENSDWVVKDSITYYPVFRSTVKVYAVSFTYKDSTGQYKTDVQYLPYNAAIVTPDNVNRSYASEGIGYNLLGWSYMNPAYQFITLDVDTALLFNDINVSLSDINLKGEVPETPISFTAVYDNGAPVPYTITFKYKNANGVDKTYTADVKHGSLITAETIADLAIVPAQYDDGSALYTFANKWIVTDGASDKAEFETNELTTFSPTSHVTFEAVYGEGVPFYTVTYVDGDKTFTERVLKDNNLPAWFENDSEYIPTKADAETGEYIFAGWFDEKQTDKKFEVTNGTEYTTESAVTGDLVLYPQFTFKPFTYKITFLNWDGSVLAEGDFEAGESFEETLEDAENAAQKVADKEYYYTFIGWDNDPGNCVCGGKELVFTAQYKPGYITYKARWYADEASMNGAIPEFETVGQDGLLAITSHIYGAAVYAPSVKLVIPQGEVFDGWYYRDGEDEKAYHRGMTITSSMSFYAKTKVPEAEKGFVVTTDINGVTADYRVAENETAEVIGRPLDGYVNADSHNKFDGWYTTAEFTKGTEFDITAIVTEDIKVYAKFTVSAHVMDQKELIEAPTYYATGSEYVWCACDKENTIAKDENGKYIATEIPVLQDTTAPTGTIYLGGQSWSSTGTPAYTTDNDPISIRVNDKADVIITTNDAGIGVRVIRAFAFPANTVLTAESYGAAQQVALEVFRDDSQKINNNANYVVKLGDFSVAELNAEGTPVTDDEGNVKYTALKDGEAYILYYYVNDKATTANGAPDTGNQLNRLVRTAKFIYDESAPEFYITGDSNAATATTSTITYCGQAIIKDIEANAIVTINNNAVDTEGKTTYAINDAGNYVITITDEAGNSASKKIKVTAGHDEVKTSQDVTCEADGYEKITCAVCAKVIKNEVIASEGHKYGGEITISATCTTDGYVYKECSVCGDVETISTTPKFNHVDQGTTEVVTKKATCSVEGVKTIYCAACNTAIKTEAIAKDTSLDGHSFGANKTRKATCDEDGEVYRQCKYCYITTTVKTLDKLDHKDTGRYTVILTQPTCYAEGEKATYCKVCDEQIGEKVAVEKIAHNLKLVKYEGEANDMAAEFKNGYMRYECQVVGCGYKSEPTAIKVTVQYTVTFEGVETVFTKAEGETITMADVYKFDDTANDYIYPSKASDEYKNYTFAGWKGADGKIVNLPITVKKNETYVAAYTETTRTYTHTFKVNDNDTAAFAVILGTYEDTNKVPSYVPTKQATATERYEFLCWTTSAGEKVEDFTMTEDATFVAKFDTIETKFKAVFYNENNDLIWYTSVTSNEVVQYANTDGNGLIEPKKAPDDDYHYTFAGWKYVGNDELTALGNIITSGITSDIRIFAEYTKAEHDFEVVNDETKTWAANCQKEGQTTEICAECGVEKVTVLPKTGHAYENKEDGSKVCTVCGDFVEAEAKEVTLTFKHGDNIITTVTVAEGKTYEIKAADKAATDEFNYTFKEWVDEDGNVVSTDATLKVTATDKNATYEAKYAETKRSYRVIYVTSDYKTLQSFDTEFEYGSAIPEYTNATPTQKRDASKHYKFIGWSTDVVNGKVTGDMMIIARFEGTPHNLNKTVTEAATCTTPATTYNACDGDGCDYRQAQSSTGDTLPHEILEGTYVEKPAGLEAGERSFTCANCGQKITEKIPANKEEITIIIYDNSGKLATTGSAHVSLYEIVDGEEVFFRGPRDTDANGVVKFEVEKGKKWKAAITGDGIEGGYGGEVKAGVNTFGKAAEEEVKPEEPSCSCSCHKNTFWGLIYRFFQKLVMWLTGNPKCCGDPDARIWG